jgi:hypothetical protein
LNWLRRGVVKLFNVLNQQKNEISTQVKNAGPSDRKIDKVYSSISKTAFLDRLKEKNQKDEDSNSDEYPDEHVNPASSSKTNVDKIFRQYVQ